MTTISPGLWASLVAAAAGRAARWGARQWVRCCRRAVPDIARWRARATALSSCAASERLLLHRQPAQHVCHVIPRMEKFH